MVWYGMGTLTPPTIIKRMAKYVTSLGWEMVLYDLKQLYRRAQYNEQGDQ